MVEYIQTFDQYPCKFNCGQIFSFIVLSLSIGEKYIFKKLCLGEICNFLPPGVVMIKTWGRVLLEGMSKNEQIQFCDSQMYFPVILTP